MQITKTCERCGKPFLVYPYRAKTARYCSVECKRDRVTLHCISCEKEFQVTTSYAKKHDAKFCSLVCMFSHQSAIIACLNCGKKFRAKLSLVKSGRKKFCSKQCVYQWASENLTGSRRYNWVKKIARICFNCGSKFQTDKWKVDKGRGKYCSAKCKVEHMRGEHAPGWKGGLSFEPYPVQFNGRFKEMIRERDRYMCQVCGKQGRIVHHINYDKQETTAENCVTLCAPCHSITNGKREMWQHRLQLAQSQRGIYEKQV